MRTWIRRTDCSFLHCTFSLCPRFARSCEGPAGFGRRSPAVGPHPEISTGTTARTGYSKMSHDFRYIWHLFLLLKLSWSSVLKYIFMKQVSPSWRGWWHRTLSIRRARMVILDMTPASSPNFCATTGSNIISHPFLMSKVMTDHLFSSSSRSMPDLIPPSSRSPTSSSMRMNCRCLQTRWSGKPSVAGSISLRRYQTTTQKLFCLTCAGFVNNWMFKQNQNQNILNTLWLWSM